MAEKPNQNTLYVLWTTGDPVTANNMVFMYTVNALKYKWWERVHIIVWGASTELLVYDADVRKKMQQFLKLGGVVSVCRKCAENIKVMDAVKAMEIPGQFTVFYLGAWFSKILHSDVKVLSV